MKLLFKRLRLTLAIILVFLIICITLENKTLTVSEYSVSSDKIPTEFDGFRIVQVSDLHCTSFGKNNSRLLSLIEESNPDIIVITGDLFDSRRTKHKNIGASFAKEASKIAPTYCVTGNHEFANDNFDELELLLTDAGVIVLRNEWIPISRSDSTITLIGADDISVMKEALNLWEVTDIEVITDSLETASDGVTGYGILLAHRPEYIDIYAEYGVDLVLSGHAHGGQFRFPLIGGLYAPGQGLFPKYTEGVHQYGNTSMIISRGLGRSSFPFRLGNPPELVVITLKSS